MCTLRSTAACCLCLEPSPSRLPLIISVDDSQARLSPSRACYTVFHTESAGQGEHGPVPSDAAPEERRPLQRKERLGSDSTHADWELVCCSLDCRGKSDLQPSDSEATTGSDCPGQPARLPDFRLTQRSISHRIRLPRLATTPAPVPILVHSIPTHLHSHRPHPTRPFTHRHQAFYILAHFPAQASANPSFLASHLLRHPTSPSPLLPSRITSAYFRALLPRARH